MCLALGRTEDPPVPSAPRYRSARGLPGSCYDRRVTDLRPEARPLACPERFDAAVLGPELSGRWRNVLWLDETHST